MADTTHLAQLEFACVKLQLRTTKKKLLQTSKCLWAKNRRYKFYNLTEIMTTPVLSIAIT